MRRSNLTNILLTSFYIEINQLEQNGVSIEEGESLEDPELLMIVMETREALEEAQSESEVDEIRKVNKGL